MRSPKNCARFWTSEALKVTAPKVCSGPIVNPFLLGRQWRRKWFSAALRFEPSFREDIFSQRLEDNGLHDNGRLISLDDLVENASLLWIDVVDRRFDFGP